MSDSGARPNQVSFRALALAGAVSLVAAGLGARAAYHRFIHYEPRAALHVPASSQWAARVDVEQVVLFAPVRKHLMPLLNKLPLQLAPPPGSTQRLDVLQRLRRVAGLNLGVDVREIVVTGGGRDSGQWSVIVGGLFDSHGVVPAVHEALKSGGVRGLSSKGDGTLRFEQWGAVFGQAADGVLIVASDTAQLHAALGRGPRHRELGLPIGGSGAIAAEFLSGDSPLVPAIPGLSDLSRLRVDLVPGQVVELVAHLLPRSSASRSGLESTLLPWLNGDNRPLAAAADWGERALLARARISKNSGDNLVISSHWTRDEFDRALRSLASAVERRLHPRSALPERLPAAAPAPESTEPGAQSDVSRVAPSSPGR